MQGPRPGPNLPSLPWPQPNELMQGTIRFSAILAVFKGHIHLVHISLHCILCSHIESWAVPSPKYHLRGTFTSLHEACKPVLMKFIISITLDCWNNQSTSAHLQSSYYSITSSTVSKSLINPLETLARLWQNEMLRLCGSHFLHYAHCRSSTWRHDAVPPSTDTFLHPATANSVRTCYKRHSNEATRERCTSILATWASAKTKQFKFPITASKTISGFWQSEAHRLVTFSWTGFSGPPQISSKKTSWNANYANSGQSAELTGLAARSNQVDNGQRLRDTSFTVSWSTYGAPYSEKTQKCSLKSWISHHQCKQCLKAIIWQFLAWQAGSCILRNCAAKICVPL